MSSRVRRTLIIAGVVVICLVLAGATYQGVATALERRQFPHPGRLVDVGGHQLHIQCVGEGSPIVLLEAPAMGLSSAWGWVEPAVADVTRVCSYDRAGLGWSETGDTTYDPAGVPAQLHALVEHAGERGPFVLAGHGLGATLATLYASQFSDEVAALVLIDSPAAERAGPEVTRLVSASPWLARAGVLRATRLLSDNATGLPEPSAGAMRAFLNRPDHLTRAARELSRWDEAVALAGAAPLNPRMHLERIATGDAGGVAFLNNRDDAEAVAARIIEAVKLARVKQ